MIRQRRHLLPVQNSSCIYSAGALEETVTSFRYYSRKDGYTVSVLDLLTTTMTIMSIKVVFTYLFKVKIFRFRWFDQTIPDKNLFLFILLCGNETLTPHSVPKTTRYILKNRCFLFFFFFSAHATRYSRWYK